MVGKKRIVLYVEGGGDSDSLHVECRRAFSSFLEKAGLAGKMPRIVACGSRDDAYDKFKTACCRSTSGCIPLLLVDSEESVSDEYSAGTDCRKWRPWEHLKARDNWDRPENASDEQCNLMVECMENWLIADVESLRKYYGHDFNGNKISARAGNDVEGIHKSEVYSLLDEATRNTKQKGRYSKGGHSFEILALIDSNLVIAKSKWAERFVKYLRSL